MLPKRHAAAPDDFVVHAEVSLLPNWHVLRGPQAFIEIFARHLSCLGVELGHREIDVDVLSGSKLSPLGDAVMCLATDDAKRDDLGCVWRRRSLSHVRGAWKKTVVEQRLKLLLSCSALESFDDSHSQDWSLTFWSGSLALRIGCILSRLRIRHRD